MKRKDTSKFSRGKTRSFRFKGPGFGVILMNKTKNKKLYKYNKINNGESLNFC